MKVPENLIAPDNFNFKKYANLNVQNFKHEGWRKLFTRTDPFLFNWVYLSHHLDPRETGTVSLAPFHVDMYDDMAYYWTIKEPNEMEVRRTYHLPRDGGKSTVWCLGNPIWAHAHKHVRFTVIFTHSTELAAEHLDGIKQEFDTNKLLQKDYPELCWPARTVHNRSRGNRIGLWSSEGGDTIMARGMDKANLGIKRGQFRPDAIILDDIQPKASEFGEKPRAARLADVENVILPMNTRAKVVWTGTTVKRGCLVHELVKAAHGLPHENWVEGQNFRPHHYPPVIRNAQGAEESIWPEKWSMAFFNKIRRTDSYALNYANMPKTSTDPYWREGQYKREAFKVDTRSMSLDIAVTDTESSDYCAIAVGGYSLAKQKVRVDYAVALKANWAEVRRIMAELAEDNPDIEDWVIETTNGGDLVIAQLMPAIPKRFRRMHNCGKGQLACPPGTGIHQRKPWEPKRVRARRQSDYYQYDWVNHCGQTAALEEQQIRFPEVANDDLVDTNGQMCDFYLFNKTKPGEQVGAA